MRLSDRIAGISLPAPFGDTIQRIESAVSGRPPIAQVSDSELPAAIWPWAKGWSTIVATKQMPGRCSPKGRGPLALVIDGARDRYALAGTLTARAFPAGLEAYRKMHSKANTQAS
jgi:hypothetical protein